LLISQTLSIFYYTKILKLADQYITEINEELKVICRAGGVLILIKQQIYNKVKKDIPAKSGDIQL